MLPEPVFLFDRGEDFGRIGFGAERLWTINTIGEDRRELLVSVLSGNEAAGGERYFGLGVELLGGGEEVDERQRALLRHALHRGGVELEVGVFLGAIRNVAAFRQVFVSDGGNQHQSRCGDAVVGLAQGVDGEGVEFRLVVGHALGPVEGFVITEEGDEGVCLQMGEPLVGC